MLLIVCLLLEDQFPEGVWNMKIGHWRSRRPPCGVKTRFGGPLNTKEIDAPAYRRIEILRQILHRQNQFRPPDLPFFIYARAPLQPALQIALFSRRNIQVNPETIRTYFKFLVTDSTRSGRLQKHLRNVALPKLVPPPIRFGISKGKNASKSRHEPQTQRISTPEQTHFRFSLRIGVFPLPIAAKPNRGCALPCRIQRKSLRVSLPREFTRDGRLGFASRRRGCFSIDHFVRSRNNATRNQHTRKQNRIVPPLRACAENGRNPRNLFPTPFP
jgi:hypothetical protein